MNWRGMEALPAGLIAGLLGVGFAIDLPSGADEIPAAAAQLWPGFRGAGGSAHAVHASPPTTWDAKEGKNLVWKTAIARHGMSSPVVCGGRVFITAADHHVRQVLCHDATTGQQLWNHDVSAVPEGELPFVLEETGYASPTPVTNGRLLAAIFATGELVCVDTDGNRVWITQLGIPGNHYGHASSLIGNEKLVFVQFDQKEHQQLLAFDFATGKPLWQANRRAISWSSPILVDNSGRPELILSNSREVDSYDPDTGNHLWRMECLAGEVASSAAYADGVVFVASEGSAATAIDISNHDAGPKILWQWEKSLPDAASLLATRDFLIIPTGFGTVTCLAAKTGKVQWEHEFDRGFSSSPILADNRVHIVDLAGTTQIFKLGKDFNPVGTASLGEEAYATPAFVGDRVYLRGLQHLFCVGLGK